MTTDRTPATTPVGWGPIVFAAFATFILVPLVFGGGVAGLNMVINPLMIGPLEHIYEAFIFATLSFFVTWVPLIIAIPIVHAVAREGPPPLIYALIFGLACALVFCLFFNVFGSGDVPAILILGALFAVVFHVIMGWAHRWALDQAAKGSA